jgi:hypothetical protein
MVYGWMLAHTVPEGFGQFLKALFATSGRSALWPAESAALVRHAHRWEGSLKRFLVGLSIWKGNLSWSTAVKE